MYTWLLMPSPIINPFMPGESHCMTRVVWALHTFENNFGINHKFAMDLKESCYLDYNQHFFSKYSLKIPFVSEISQKYRHEWVNAC